MKVKSESEVTQSCPTLSDPMDCSLPGSYIHGIFQARILEWVAIASQSNLDLPKGHRVEPVRVDGLFEVILMLLIWTRIQILITY